VRLLKDMGVHFYRFSISWARVMPDGTNNTINQAGINYYNMLINELLGEGIIPMVTLFHWDLPQHLQDMGAWHNEELVVHFKNYADLCYREFGDRVKHWMTFNEPWVITWLGYGIGVFAPGIYEPAEGQYKTSHTIIKAHAEAWHVYNDNYRSTQKGEVGIVLNSDWAEPRDPQNPLDLAASDRTLQFSLGWYGHPIFKNGDYPEAMKEYIGNKSIAQGYPQSRLPAFTTAEKARIAGTSDFFGLNHYTTHYCFDAPNPNSEPNYDQDKDVGSERDPSWPPSGSDWLYVVPWGLRKLLTWVKNEFGDPKIYVTENGVSDHTGTLNDDTRVFYYQHYINNVMKAVTRDGVNVKGYTAWALMDNFEWGSGYDEKFGMHAVDFTDPARPRTPKDSARYYSQLVRDNGFVESSTTNNPTSTTTLQNAGSTRVYAIGVVLLCVVLSIL